MKNILALTFAIATAATFTIPSMSYAAEQCRDPKGKFIKCPAPAPASATRCKDAKGKFAKCGTPGANPV
ncbi:MULTISPECIES: hypothetical protein [unclassified Beijerinckia]|uniref:hypothetical protein n=1 Tax=unclassified Beijerinckia TaxID=2638183 RepID=UPI000898FC7C|nr:MULTISPECIES: hypothetical protein [unclassified Beijerinckia]MDH7798416.1 hypothetical protein [Beijerinckia sp. GAS462]SED20125.1 hypothetical protein SAMN05443249_4713 [Beijerinckia sp. 28-YEA-48]